jgi:hypothetical protein
LGRRVTLSTTMIFFAVFAVVCIVIVIVVNRSSTVNYNNDVNWCNKTMEAIENYSYNSKLNDPTVDNDDNDDANDSEDSEEYHGHG